MIHTVPGTARGSRPVTELSKWTLFARPSPEAWIRLFCFPYAGGGASVYRAWSDALDPEIEVWPIQLPGRENRFAEPAAADLRRLAHTLATVLRHTLDERPYALFGHSMGAAIVFELARTLRAEGVRPPEHLFVAAHAAPQLTDRNPPAHNLPTDQFLDLLRTYDGTSEQIFEEQELLHAFLPTLRADFSLFETYRYQEEPPFSCPLSVFGGISDFSVSADRLRAWEHLTAGRFCLRQFAGGHFFLHTARAQVWRAIREDLRLAFRAATRATHVTGGW